MRVYICVHEHFIKFILLTFVCAVKLSVDIGAHQPATAPFPTRHSLAFIMVKVIVSLPGSRSSTQLVS